MKVSPGHETPSDMQWYRKTHESVLENLDASSHGLESEDAAHRLNQYGYNRLPSAPRRSALTRLLLQFHNVLIYVLLGAALTTALLDHMMDTMVILAVVIINAIIGFVQEGKAEKAMEAIRNMLAPNASVLRDGERHTVPGENLVPGDIVLLEAGDRVPADLRLLRSHSLQIQEAILTGESVPVEKQTTALDEELPLGDRSCMAYSGTLVTSGQGRGVVVATGSNAEIGRISGLLSQVETLTTPLVRQMDVFAKWLTAFILALAALLLAYGYFFDQYEFSDMFMIVVGLSVAAIPEGLPAVLTITLAIGVQAMARRNAIIRRLPAIETLGSVSVICTDKTGTLTRNEMSVSTVLCHDRQFRPEGEGYTPDGNILLEEKAIEASDFPALTELALAATLCNDAELRPHKDQAWTMEGDPMEGALLTFAGKAGINQGQVRSDWERIDAIPFDAQHRFMATLNLNSTDDSENAFIFVKGAPEKILDMCSLQRTLDGGSEALDRDYWRRAAESVANEGQRVLAFAVIPVARDHGTLSHDHVQSDLILLGMTGLIDPPRPEAISAVVECHNAGIRIKMITGDHAGTALAIGRQIGLQNTDRVLTGAELDSMSDSALGQAVLDTDIFARTSPEHKLRLVMALQAHGKIVAMTGDGVNDAPALKRADAGIAMGRKGSEAAKEASELVLADDNFASIAAAVREGRTVYDNIKKVITWTLPTNGGEAATIMVALLFGMNLPITPIQILWVNLVTAVTLGIALAFEPTDAGTMQRPPRPHQEALLTGTLIWQIVLTSLLFLACVFGIFFYTIESGHSIELARTLAMNTLVVMEIFYLFYIRNLNDRTLTWAAVRGTKMVWLTVSLVILAQLAITCLPFMQTVFSTETISLNDLALILGVGLVMFIIIEVEKQIRLTLRNRKTNEQP